MIAKILSDSALQCLLSAYFPTSHFGRDLFGGLELYFKIWYPGRAKIRVLFQEILLTFRIAASLVQYLLSILHITHFRWSS
jgi:hypothetical protein